MTIESQQRFLLKKRQPLEKLTDKAFKLFTLLMASTVSFVLLGIFIVVFYESTESMSKYGLNFLVTSAWNPVDDKYGAFTAIYGTLVTSLASLTIAVRSG